MSSTKTKPPTKVEAITTSQSDTYGEKLVIPVISSDKDELSYILKDIMSLNQTSMDKLNVYGYADIPIIMEESKDGILRLELQLNDRRCIQAFQ